MLPPIKIDASLEGPLFRNMGTFWTSVFQEQDKVRVLLDVGLRTRLLSSFKQAVRNLAGDLTFSVQVSHVQIPFKANEVIEAGMQLYDDPDKEFNYGDLDSYESSYGNYRIRYFALQLAGVLPLSIHSEERTLILGTDFFVNRNLIYFRQDPRKLFAAGTYLVTRGLNLGFRSYLNFFTQNNVPGIDDLVIRYIRQAQTPQNFRLALCAIANMGIIRIGGVLRAITETFGGTTIYTFDQESVRVAYPHTPLEVGVSYPSLTVIGDLIQTAQAEVKETAWWRKIDWKGGFVLDPIVNGVHNLPVADTNLGVAYVAGQDPGSSGGNRVHARIQLSNDFENELPYWEEVAKRETASGFYLNSILGLQEDLTGAYETIISETEEANRLNRQLRIPAEQPDFRALPESQLVNPLDVFFQAVLGQTAFVINIDQIRTLNQPAIFDFISREMPVGATPIIIGHVSGIIDDTANLDDELEVEDTVNMVGGDVLTVEDPVEIDDLVKETVSIVNQLPLA